MSIGKKYPGTTPAILPSVTDGQAQMVISKGTLSKTATVAAERPEPQKVIDKDAKPSTPVKIPAMKPAPIPDIHGVPRR